MKYASIGPIAIHLPDRVESNDHLAAEFPRWDLDLIFSKTGIANRHIAAKGECASDLGVKAAQKLFHDYDIDPHSIDFVLLCTQTPDYPLPTTACLMQERLGLKNLDRSSRFQSGLLRFCVWSRHGRWTDSYGFGAPHSAHHSRNLHSIHRS